MALTVKDIDLIHDVHGAVHRVEKRFFVKILFEGDERQIAMNKSQVLTQLHYCDEELVFPLKESLQTSGTQSLKLDVYQRDIRAIDMFIGTLDISLGLLINNRYQSPPLSLKNESLEESTVSVTVEYDDPSSPAKEIHDGSLTLGEVRAALWGARYEWIDLGLALGIPHSTIQVIEMDHRTIIDRFTAMLREWLMISSNSTWSDLVKALRSPTVHRPIVAIRIEDKYIKSDVSSVQEKENTARSSMLQRARMEAALWGARAKWFELGLALNLSEETLEIFIMGIGVELWRARIGLFNGGRGGRPRKASLAHQKLQCDVTIIVTKVLWTQYAEDTTSHRDKCVVESVLNNATDKAPPSNCHEDVVSEKKKESVTFTTNHIRNHSSSICIGLTLILIGAILVFVSLLLLLAGDVELNPGPGLATVLTISDILEVYDKVRSASPNWFNLGLALKLSYTDLTNFRETYSGDNDVCLREALARRLQSGDPLTWGGMCTALKNSMVARNDVAEAIEGSLERVSERLERAQNSTTKTASESSTESLDGAISEVVSISRELEVDSMEMETLFNKLVSQLCQSLEVRRIDKDSLVACLMGFNSLKKVFGKTNQCVFRNQRNKLRKCSTSAEVWKIIADYFSFFNYEMVDHITDSFGTAEDKEKMKLYKANFVEYVKRRIRPVTSSDSREDTVTMIVQLDSTYDDCELNRLKLFERNLCSILKISKGCVELLPYSITSDIFPLSTDRDVHNYQAECRSDKGDNTSRFSLDTVLTISDILEVYEKVRSVSPNWFNLGLALKLSYTDLTNFRETYSGDNDVCLREALARRLQSGDPLTWGGMCTALKNSMVARNDVAEAIEGSLERVSERLERAQNSTTKTASESSTESLDGAISEVVSISRELEVDSMEMETLFNKLVSQLCQSLEVRRIDKDSLVACLMGFNCLNKVFGKTNQCVFRNQRNKLRKCSTSAEVWQIIADYFSFFDYEMVDHITDSFGTAEDKEKMKLYKANFVKYVKRRVYPVTENISSDSREDTVTMIVQLDSTYDDCELNRLKLLKRNLCSILNLNESVLKFSKISKGCVELLPSSITSDIFPLSTDRDVHNYQAECRSDKGDNTSRSSLGSLTLGEVRAVMWGARYVWRKLGITLGLPHGTIQVIDKDHRTITDCFTAMLREWLMISPNPTWFELVEALRSPTVHLNVLADEIEDKYIKSDVSSVQEKEDTARSSTLQRARMEAALWGARAKWFELGLALNLSKETLEAIRKNRTVLADRFTAMLGEWFQSSPNPTWSELVKALRSPTINRPDIAAEIEDKLIKINDSSENKDTAVFRGSLALREVRAALWDDCTGWRSLGIELEIPYETLMAIKKIHRTSKDRFTAMLREWLMISPNPIWSELVEALRSPTIMRIDIADKIEKKYIKSDVSPVQEKEDTARSSMLQGARMEAALWHARAKWFELGLALDLSEETLKAIHKNHTVLADRFTAMLGEWFQSSPNPTWSELVKALRSPTINRPDIAAEIEDKLIKSDDSSLQENKDTAGSLTLREVRTALWSARAKWMSLGLVLGLPVGTLEAIQEANLTNMPGDCLTELLAEWLKSSPNPTWSQLVEALRSPIINCPDIADEIEDKYIKSDDSSVQESKDTASSASVEEQLKYLHKLNELLTDTENTINIRYLKLYLIGLSGLGKTTFRKRLLGHLLNLASIPPQDRKRCSTLLAECNQVLAVSSDSKLFLKASTDIDNEAQLIFAYMIGLQQVVKAAISKVVESADPTNDPIVDAIDASIDDSKPKEDYDTHPTVEVDPSKKQGNKEAKSKAPETNVDTNEDSKAQPSTKQVPQEGSKPAKPKAPETKVDKIIENLRNIVKRGNYMEQLVGTVLLNIIDIGGQPGFMEMLPFLSKGPGMFLAFFPLDKDLDELYEVSYEHDQDKITPFQAKYTIRETLSQILSAISHHVTVDSDLDSKIAEKVEHFADLQAVVSLVGTYQDVLEIQAKSEVVQEKLKGDYPGLDANTLEAAIQLILEVQQEVESEQKVEEIFFEFEAEVGKQDSFSNNLVEHVEQKAKAKATTDKQQKPTTPQEDTELQSKVEVLEKTLPPEIKNKLKQNTPKAVQLLLQMKQCNETLSKLASAVDKLSTDSTIQAETKKRLQAKLQEKHKVLSTITSNFADVISHPDDSHFFSVDNFRGEEADIDPIRKHLQTVFDSRFDDAEIQIRPAQLLYGIILRKEFEIATMEECIQIGKELEMDEDEVKFTIWYLHQCVGALLYYPDIKDKESYFKNHVICSPNVVFNSISLLIVESLLSLHSGDKRSRFTAAEIKKWQEFGQFSIPVIKLCCSKTNKAKVKEGELIPVDKLVKLLEHVSLLAPIVGKGPQPVYFMPAILECASKEELSNAPAIDSNTPSPIKITFESGYMPIGVFCAMISKLVSEGQNKILGLKWNLRESRVMRNLVSFEVDSAKHDITLVAHVNCYEIRLTRREDCNMHDLCSYVLTTVLYMMSGISKKIEPIIAFDCQCPKHQKAEEVCLCKLKDFFRCEHGRVDSLPPHQECWFAKEVKLDEKAVLEALRFADPDDLSFKWTRKGRKVASGSDNELTVDKVTRDHCDGFYTCEVSKNKELCFKVHHCLRISEATATGDDITLKTVKDATWDARAKWDHLAINLDVDEGTIKSIERSHNGRVDECFVAMLEAWFKKGSPSWSVMVEALRAPSVNRRGLANNIEKKFMNNSE